ncbi:PHP domain-containing protein [Methanoculleus bourgensis]|uniref:PHP domain-containing protein n=1 Tax=Methanoculleus bourgensis TaxID=83986 RepID=UPI001BDA5C48|nr:PHP domain-containing protein [Methanoculleus bourgensis]
MIFDLHVHSRYSPRCGYMQPEEIVKTAIKKGLDGIAVTDHNTIAGGIRAKAFETRDFRVIVGSEVLTDRGEVIGLFLSEEVAPGNFEDVVAAIRDQSGVVVLPHPFDRLRSTALHPQPADVGQIDAVEGFNARCIFQADNRAAAEFGREHNLAVIAGSDAHFPGEIGRAGIRLDGEPEECLQSRDFQAFGRRSSLLIHARTKIMKFSRI